MIGPEVSDLSRRHGLGRDAELREDGVQIPLEGGAVEGGAERDAGGDVTCDGGGHPT